MWCGLFVSFWWKYFRINSESAFSETPCHSISMFQVSSPSPAASLFDDEPRQAAREEFEDKHRDRTSNGFIFSRCEWQCNMMSYVIIPLAIQHKHKLPDLDHWCCVIPKLEFGIHHLHPPTCYTSRQQVTASPAKTSSSLFDDGPSSVGRHSYGG